MEKAFAPRRTREILGIVMAEGLLVRLLRLRSLLAWHPGLGEVLRELNRAGI